MDSQLGPESASEEDATEETVLEEDTPRRFRASRLQRWATVVLTVLFLFIKVLEYTESDGLWEIALDSTLIVFLILPSASRSLRSVLVGKREIRKVLPLWKDQTVQVSEIRRVHVPVTLEGLWLYTEPKGNVALNIGAGFENPDELKELIIRQAPPTAEVTGLGQEEHPS